MPKYKRPPITEAVVEVRVEGPIPMETIERVRDRLRQFYPAPEQMLIETNFELRGTEARTFTPTPAGFRMTAGDGASLVSVGPHSIGTSTLPPYEGWEAFIATAQRNWEIWKKLIGWMKIVRIGVRYLNRIDIPSISNTLNIDDYLTFTIKGPPLDLPPMNSFAINETRPLGEDDCDLILNAGLVPSPLVKTLSLLLDVDISRSVDLPQNDEALWALVNRMRDHKNLIFEACITGRARELFDQ